MDSDTPKDERCDIDRAALARLGIKTYPVVGGWHAEDHQVASFGATEQEAINNLTAVRARLAQLKVDAALAREGFQMADDPNATDAQIAAEDAVLQAELKARDGQ